MQVRVPGLLLICALAGAASAGTYGMVGIDFRPGWGSFWQTDGRYLPFDPVFRAGTSIAAGIAVGAELSLIRTFPENTSPFLSTPEVAFGPTVAWSAPTVPVTPYVLAGASLLPQTGFPFYDNELGIQTRLAVGAFMRLPLTPIGVGLEAGWCHQAIRARQTLVLQTRGDNVFVGVRLLGGKR